MGRHEARGDHAQNLGGSDASTRSGELWVISRYLAIPFPFHRASYPEGIRRRSTVSALVHTGDERESNASIQMQSSRQLPPHVGQGLVQALTLPLSITTASLKACAMTRNSDLPLGWPGRRSKCRRRKALGEPGNLGRDLETVAVELVVGVIVVVLRRSIAMLNSELSCSVSTLAIIARS